MTGKRAEANTMRQWASKHANSRSQGFTLIASLLMLTLLTGIAIGLLMMVNTEGKVGSTDLQNNMAFHAAEGGIEKMANDLSSAITSVQNPSASALCNVAQSSNQPSLLGVNWNVYAISAPGITCPAGTGTPTSTWGQISGGPNAGLWAQIIPITMQTSAAMYGAQEVSMTRGAQIALIPVFQYGVFCEGDCGFFDSPNLTFTGRVHTNQDLYLGVAAGSTLTFNNKLEAYGNVVTEQLPNGLASSSFNDTGSVYIPTTTNGCEPNTSTNCTLKATNGGTAYGDGSVTGAGSTTAQTGTNYNSSYWNPFSGTTTNHMLINGNYGSKTTPGTGAKKLSMPFVNGTTLPYQLIRRPMSSDSPALTQSREYNLAQIHVLLSDDPADLPGGASDTNNVRLANVVANASGVGASNPYGIATSTGTNLSGYSGGTASLPSGTAYTTYFATATNAIPVQTCTGTYTSSGTVNYTINCLPDWPYPPAPWTPSDMTNVNAGTDASGCVLLCPSSQSNAWSTTNTSGVVGAPFISSAISATLAGGPALLGSNGTYNGTSANPTPTFLPCPPAPDNLYAPGNCPTSSTTAPAWPYLVVDSPSYSTTQTPVSPVTTVQSATAASATWNLIDGWLRVEYIDNSGVWHPVTNEWLGLGFARDVQPPTAPYGSGSGTNPINPKAILLFQRPADRYTIMPSAGSPTTALNSFSTTAATTGTGDVCPSPTGAGTYKTCPAWTVTNPQEMVDSATNSWLFGASSSTYPSAATASTLPQQSVTRFNWYPINFYDAREGEPRDTLWDGTNAADNTCTTNGIMNAVEVDVGNLKLWLNGTIGTSGTNVNSSAENGYILYFSDRRGMLPNPVEYGTSFTKSGDSGLEDVINANGSADGAAGTPDGVLEPVPTGRTLSPEDVAELGLAGTPTLLNYGVQNLGLGFYGTTNNPVAEPALGTGCTNAKMPCTTNTATTNPGINMWYQITSGDTNLTSPDPFSTASYNSRIQYCSLARKNWVSGARHVLKLVDGSLGNVPTAPGGTTADPGGFTVSSENPVYIQGNYNSNSSDTFWTTGVDEAGHASAAVIADTVTVLSSNWVDEYSTMGNGATTCGSTAGNCSPTLPSGNRTAATTYYRVAVAGGKNLAFPFPSWENNTDYGFGTDGGIHNFLHFLEDWSSATLNYGGSLVSLYYSTYNTGVFKCCSYSVYQPPTRNYVFDSDFTVPSGLPPGTPMFRDVESLSYWQNFATRSSSN